MLWLSISADYQIQILIPTHTHAHAHTLRFLILTIPHTAIGIDSIRITPRAVVAKYMPVIESVLKILQLASTEGRILVVWTGEFRPAQENLTGSGQVTGRIN